MNRRLMPTTKVMIFALVLAASASLSEAAEFWLRAEATTIRMPDDREVVVWGFAQDSAFDAGDGEITVPGPVLTVPAGDSTLTIHLQNKLPAGNQCSIVIPGQGTVPTPIRHSIPSVYEGRVRSFTYEADTENTSAVTYTWNNFRAGTFLYHSGTHPACQVQMGLYGCVKKDASAGSAYDGVAYDREIVLLMSEIDPDFHDAVANGDFGAGKPVTSTTHYRPKYFLVNGAPFTAGTPAIAAGAPGEKVLLRLLNAGILTHALLLQGLYMTTLAEDGFPYRHPRQRYCVGLPALKTMDVLVTAVSGGTFPLYDRTLRLTNDAAAPGGLLTYLEIVEN